MTDQRSGKQISFLGHTFYIDSTVHRPRASTEFITKAGYISYIQQLGGNITVAEIGAGSGVTAISCALACPGIKKVYGVDLYADAIKIAGQNSRALGTQSKVELIQGDLFEPLLDKPVDVILANLPFANTEKVQAIQAETPVMDEPVTSILGGDTGFELYEKLFAQLKQYAFVDKLQGIWVYCDTDHRKLVEGYHQKQFSEFKLMAFQDAYKPHFSHFLLTRPEFKPEQELKLLD